jgi:hypothetical protein
LFFRIELLIMIFIKSVPKSGMPNYVQRKRGNLFPKLFQYTTSPKKTGHLLAVAGYLSALLGALAVGLGGVVSGVDDEVLGAVVVAAGQVAVEDGLCAVGVALLGVERGA